MKNEPVDNVEKKSKEFPVYLAKIRTDLVLQLDKLGLSMQDISDVFSVGITKGGVHQIIKKNEKNTPVI